MKIVINCLIIFLSTGVFGQQTDTTYTFKQVGWTIILPGDFKVMTQTEDSLKKQQGVKLMEDANDFKADVSQTKTLISATKNQGNLFNATVTPFNTKVDGDFSVSNQSVKQILYKTLKDKMPDAKIDTVTNTRTIDGISFDDFHISVSIMGSVKPLFHMFLLSKYYKGYDFGITYIYMNDEIKNQIEKIINTSKFEK
jgi:hypothetical protein